MHSRYFQDAFKTPKIREITSLPDRCRQPIRPKSIGIPAPAGYGSASATAERRDPDPASSGWRDLPLVVQFLARRWRGHARGDAGDRRLDHRRGSRTPSSPTPPRAGALYLESFVSPLSQELAANDRLSEPAVRALDEVFATTGIGKRIVSFKIWKPGGLIAHASDPTLIGKRFDPKPELQAAWAGKVTGTFDDLDDAENATEAALGIPLLEVYSPLHEVWSGKIIAVAEFYEVATDLAARPRRRPPQELAPRRRRLPRQRPHAPRHRPRRRPHHRPAEGRARSRSPRAAHRPQNAELRRRAIDASARATAQAERSLRRVSADLHDGPAQYVALAAMRLDSLVPDDRGRPAEAATLREALQTALTEIRASRAGCRCPNSTGCRSPRSRAARSTRTCAQPGRRSRSPIRAGRTRRSTNSTRICLYRFLQEALSNAARHAPGADVRVGSRSRPTG